ncbi:MAG TPA: phosphatase PAP2 family protein [Candidatus Acidoferrales bacterium]|nr:phosphatase PAP2 family protein [Candidatus Acidoferrales bacterium]
MDYRIEQIINSPAGGQPPIDSLMRALAAYSEPAFIALVVIWLMVGLARRSPQELLGASSALLSAGLALLINVALALLWFRPRPFVSHPGTVHVLLAHSRDSSFPSDHAAAAVAIASILFVFHRRLGTAGFVIALGVGYARVYVGDHYPGDVLAGSVVGLIAAWALYQAYRLTNPWLTRWARLRLQAGR